MTYQFTAERRADLARRWQTMKVLRQAGAIETEARLIIAKRSIYEAASGATNGVPWWMIGVIDSREGGAQNLGKRHLHNGDSLQGFTHQVPANRPQVGHGPPFTWLESAIDALKMKLFDKVGVWTIERVLHELEPYNGLGYFNGPTDSRQNPPKHYPPMPSPYIWSCTNQYDPPFGPGGKYIADHVFDANTVDSQVGCAPLIKRIAEIAGIAIASGVPVIVKPAEVKPPISKEAAKAIVIGGGVAGTAGTAVIVTATDSWGLWQWALTAGITAAVIAAIVFGVIWYRHHKAGS